MEPTGIALSLDGSLLYIAEAENHIVRSVTLATGVITTIAGVPTIAAYTGDGTAARIAPDTPAACFC